jgi:hypothetical protein
MRTPLGIAALLLLPVFPVPAQTGDPVAVFTEHPRLLLRPQRLRLLKRERERTTPRWQLFETLVLGNAPMPEPGFAYALYYQVAGNEEIGRKAVQYALGPGSDLRQQALVFDWCQPILSETQSRSLITRLQQGIAGAGAADTLASVRPRALAAIALYDHAPQVPQRELERIVQQWWAGRTLPNLKAGRDVIARDDAYPLWELLHAIRDNTNIDLRETFPRYFKDFPIEHLMSHYPATFEGPDNEYRIGLTVRAGDPDLHLSALSRIAELAMVAMDVNASESQVLQGWLMHDRFMLRGTFGAPYEFLWANPYQPGLSYFHVPLIYHNPHFGKLFIRSSWEPDAAWFGFFGGVMQTFSDGRLTPLNPQLNSPPMSLQEAFICFGQRTRQWQLTLDEEQAVFVLGLQPHRAYQVEVDDEEVFEAPADAGGILALDLPRGKATGFRIKELAAGTAVSTPSARD